jgi:murein L,D-transpeptidase YafK
MNKLLKTLIFLLMTIPAIAQENFKKEQLKFERVSNAYAEKWANLQHDLQKKGVVAGFSLYIVAYKAEGKLELWLKLPNAKQYEHFKTYDFCAHSGTLGPKVTEGDGQTPEGFYKINVFNPLSNFHLSLGVNYPNKVDITRTGKNNKPGGDIYVHGNCVTIGCIPLTDDKIKEVYITAVEARNAGQKEIPIFIFPFKMTDAKLKKYGDQFPTHVAFWKTLQIGYQYFENNRLIPKIMQAKGQYVIK